LGAPFLANKAGEPHFAVAMRAALGHPLAQQAHSKRMEYRACNRMFLVNVNPFDARENL
jgi:hypothetical protein